MWVVAFVYGSDHPQGILAAFGAWFSSLLVVWARFQHLNTYVAHTLIPNMFAFLKKPLVSFTDQSFC